MWAKYQVLFDRSGERIRFVRLDDGQIVNAQDVIRLARTVGCAFITVPSTEEHGVVDFKTVSRDRRFNQEQVYIIIGLETE